MAKSKTKGYATWAIVILLFVGLLGFGAGGFSGNVRNIGTVGGKEIPVASYQNELNQQLRAFEAQIEGPVTFQQAQQLGLDQAVIGQLVTRRSLDNEAATLGLSVGDARVRDEVLRIPAFQGLDGSFDRAAYEGALDRVGLNPAGFEDQIRDDIARGLLQSAVVAGIPRPEPLAEAVIAYTSETRDIVYATITEDVLDGPVRGPTDADVQAYYDANPDQFTLPETRQITYAWIAPEMIQDDLEIDEDALRALYDERIDSFVQPERRLVERLVFADQDAVDAARAALDAEEATFDTLVALRGLDLSDVDLGDVARDDLGDAADAVFAADPGDVVGPAPSPLGPALFRVNAVLRAEETSFEDAAPDLRTELAASRARRVIDGLTEGINDLLAGGATLEDLAERTDLTLGQIAWTPETTEGIAAYDDFRAAAAMAEEAAFPELQTLEDGGLFALRLDAVTPPSLQPLEDVRDAASAGAQAQITRDAVLARAEELAQQISPLTGFDTLGLEPQEADNLNRRSFVAGTSPRFMADIFGMENTAVQVFENAPDGDVMIVRLDRITPPDPTNPRTVAEREGFGEQAAQGIAQDIFQAYSEAVRARTDVTLNQSAINAVNAQLQ